LHLRNLEQNKSKPNAAFLVILDEFGSYFTPTSRLSLRNFTKLTLKLTLCGQAPSNPSPISQMDTRCCLGISQERIFGNVSKIFMLLEGTQTALEAERYEAKSPHENNFTSRRKATLIPVVI